MPRTSLNHAPGCVWEALLRDICQVEKQLRAFNVSCSIHVQREQRQEEACHHSPHSLSATGGTCSACYPHNGAALLQAESTRLPQVFFFSICNFLQRGKIQKWEQRVMKHDTDVSSYLGHKGWKRLHTLHFIITRPGRWRAQDAHLRSKPQTRGLSDSISETRMEH